VLTCPTDQVGGNISDGITATEGPLHTGTRAYSDGMLKSWRLGSILGFPVEINLSFLLLLGLVMIAFGGVAGVMLVLLVFGSVVLHELGHALVARQLGVQVAGIELSFFGGAAKMVQLPRTANHEVLIAAAGPAVSFVLGGLGLGLGALTGVSVFAWIGWVNFVIAAFNLIPALPMDGGRILRALLSRKMDFVRATDVSVTIARVVAVAFGVIGLFGPFQLLLLAPFLWIMGTQERMLSRMMADRYAMSRDGYVERAYDDVEVLPRGAGLPRGFGQAFGGSVSPGYGHRAEMRRFAIVQRGGRFVIEEL
jgi:Zn-dependent protease